MLRSCRSLEGYALHANDGNIGHLKTMHFNDEDWKVRYLVVNIGSLWQGKDVLILPNDAYQFSWMSQNISVNLTKEQIQKALPYDSDLPVSDQHALINSKNFKSLYFVEPWSGSFLPLWFPDVEAASLKNLVEEIGDKDLRCVKMIMGYRVICRDKECGKVEDFILDCNEWKIREVVVNTGDFLPEHRVLVPVSEIAIFDTDEELIEINLSSSQLKKCPAYNEHDTVNREYVVKFYDYYGRLKYTDRASYEDFRKVDDSLRIAS